MVQVTDGFLDLTDVSVNGNQAVLTFNDGTVFEVGFQRSFEIMEAWRNSEEGIAEHYRIYEKFRAHVPDELADRGVFGISVVESPQEKRHYLLIDSLDRGRRWLRVELRPTH